MAKQTINLGTAPTGVGGDDERGAFTKVNANFDEIYAGFGGTIPAGSAASVPIIGTTSAIFQRGTNANGSWIRFQDGTQICWSPSITSATYGASAQSQYTQINFPIAFADAGYSMMATVAPVNSWDMYGVTGISRQAAGYAYVFIRNGATPQPFQIAYQTIGFWK